MWLNKYVPNSLCLLQTSNAGVSVLISQALCSSLAPPLALMEGAACLEECFPVKRLSDSLKYKQVKVTKDCLCTCMLLVLVSVEILVRSF